MKRIVMMAFIISVANKTNAQLNDNLFSFNYVMAPLGNDDINFYKTDFKINIPMSLKKGVLINSVGFDNYCFNYTQDVSFFTDDISKYYDISYGLKYMLPIAKKWVLTTGVKAAIVSNLTDEVSQNDLLLTGHLQASKTLGGIGSNQVLTFGLSYSTITGTPMLLPILSYTKTVSDKFSFGIGFPKAFADYKINEISSIQCVFLVDGCYANLNNPITITTTTQAEKVAFSSTSLGLEYRYKMDDYWGISMKGGYAISNNYQLLNNEDAEVFNFNTTSKPFFSAGITFNLKQ